MSEKLIIVMVEPGETINLRLKIVAAKEKKVESKPANWEEKIIEAAVLEAMWKIFKEPEYCEMVARDRIGKYTMIKDVADVANSIMATAKDPEIREILNLSFRGVGHILRNKLKFVIGRRRGLGFPVYWDEQRMIELQDLVK